ncbi:hypothetical protein ABFA25_14130 [Mycobacterium lepromatosis]
MFQEIMCLLTSTGEALKIMDGGRVRSRYITTVLFTDIRGFTSIS